MFQVPLKICAWATTASDVENNVMIQVDIEQPDASQMREQLMTCVQKMPHCEKFVYELVQEGPWALTVEDRNKLDLYMSWYNNITLSMGVKPQVLVFSENRPQGIPNHWIHVPNPIAWDFGHDYIHD